MTKDLAASDELAAHGDAVAIAIRRRARVIAGLIYLTASAAAYAVGFRMEIPYYFLQLLDAQILIEHPLESLWLMHSQPPGLNVVFFCVLWLAKTLAVAPESVAACVFWAIGLGATLLLYDLVADLTSSRALGWIAVLAMVASPGFHVFQNLFFYPFLILFLLLLVARLSRRWLKEGGTRRLLALVLALAAVCLTRTLYHPIWAVLYLAGAVALRLRLAGPLARSRWRAEARGIAACAAVLVLLLVAWPAKNLLVFGRFIYSSWDGLNLNATLPIPPDPDLALVVRAKEPSPEMQARLEELTRDRSQVGRELLLNLRKSDGAANWNHLTFVLTDKEMSRAAIAWRLEHPGTWLAKCAAQYSMWARPPWWQPYSQKDLGPPNAYYRAWSDLWEQSIYRDTRSFVELLVPLQAVHDEAHVRKKPVPYTLFGVLLFPGAMLVAVVLAFRGVRRRELGASVVALACGCILWNLAVPAATYGQEANRMRLPVTALFTVVCLWIVHELRTGHRQRNAVGREAARLAGGGEPTVFVDRP